MFFDNTSTRWTKSTGAIINHYNRSPHEALNGINPDDATKKAHESMILDINIVKNRKNKTVSDLDIGDKVRNNLLFNDKNSKGTDPKWSGKASTIDKVYGDTITLDDNSKYKRMVLLKVSDDAKDYGENVIAQAKRNNKYINNKPGEIKLVEKCRISNIINNIRV